MKIELWKKPVPIGDELKEIERSLSSAIIKKMYPNMSAEMGKGEVMSHYGLTTVCESVSYTLEFLVKEGLLKPNDMGKTFSRLLKNSEVKFNE